MDGVFLLPEGNDGAAHPSAFLKSPAEKGVEEIESSGVERLIECMDLKPASPAS